MHTQVHIAMMWKPLLRYSETACKEAIVRCQKNDKDTATTIWQCDIVKGKRFCVAGEREMLTTCVVSSRKVMGTSPGMSSSHQQKQGFQSGMWTGTSKTSRRTGTMQRGQMPSGKSF